MGMCRPVGENSKVTAMGGTAAYMAAACQGQSHKR